MMIAKLRKSSNLTQKGLSEVSGVYFRQIQKIETGEITLSNITPRNAKVLADVVKVPVDSLLN